MLYTTHSRKINGIEDFFLVLSFLVDIVIRKVSTFFCFSLQKIN